MIFDVFHGAPLSYFGLRKMQNEQVENCEMQARAIEVSQLHWLINYA